MDDALFSDAPEFTGYRLQKLELSNWGTFDSSRGGVHTVRPARATTLLIGQNGSGKSTLVDALLTLLVRPVVRNYNVAAGALKQERDEGTYIKGAFGRLGRDDDNRAEVQYLRPHGRHYSVLLASFCNERDQAFTLAQVLFLGSDGRPQKVYCFSQDEKSITRDCSQLSTERMRQQLEKRGFRATTSYTEYHSWFAKVTGVRQKAMDMFNQTVAVKDIQSLNRFIREHMLEPKPWSEKIDQLQNHFMQLSEAHQSLVRVRRQYELLQPIEDQGGHYRQRAEGLLKMTRLLAAADSFFRRQTVVLLGPECSRARMDLAQMARKKASLEQDAGAVQEEQRRLRNEMERAGGERLRQIPLLIEKCTSQLENKRASNQRFHNDIERIGLREKITSEAALQDLHRRLPRLSSDTDQRIRAAKGDSEKKIVERAELERSMADNRRELSALQQRQGNLPEAFADVRRRLCHDLHLQEKELPFVAELISIKPEERQWEASIEMVLRNFALSLIVPQRFYSVVSEYVNRTRLADSLGRGQRLVYLRVGERVAAADMGKGVAPGNALVHKLAFRDGHSLLPWVRAEVEERFSFTCCNTVEEFQLTAQFALTRECHVKTRGGRHEKDDREQVRDPGRYVLGWDNREKRRYLTAEVERLRASVESFGEAIGRVGDELDRLRRRREAIAAVEQVADFSTIDFVAHEREIRALLDEKESIERSSDVIRVLKERLRVSEERARSIGEARDEVVSHEALSKAQLAQWERLIRESEAALTERSRTGVLSQHEQSFAECEAFFRENPLTADALPSQERAYVSARRNDVERLRGEVAPIAEELCQRMNRYLREFTDEQADLRASVDYLDSFTQLAEQIRRDDLPRHETRFKERLNEKVIQEVGLLNGAFHTERTEVSAKIALLNQSLKQLEYRPGTYMQLEPRPVRDPEIVAFQDGLRECLAGTFEGTLEADEARYVRIEKLLARLRDEPRWRDKVTDVRRWFDFAARELAVADGEERAYYEDSTGQSGGEKAKLAFTILVAAIAYQYDIDPSRPTSNRFRFVVVDEMFSKVDDQYSEYALELFQKFGLQLLIVAPLDAKARVTEPYVGCYLHVVKSPDSNRSEIYSMTAREFESAVAGLGEIGIDT